MGCWGCGDNLTETAIADKGLKEDAFLSARLSQAERTGVESPYDGVWGDGQCGRCGGGSRERRRGGLRGKGPGADGVGPGRPQRHLALAQNKMGALGEFKQVKLCKLFQEFRHLCLLLLVQAGHLSPSHRGQRVP